MYRRYEEINENSQPVAKADFLLFCDVYAVLLLGNFVGGGSAALIRRTVFDDVGGFDPALSSAADTDFFLAVADKYEFDYAPEYLMGYRRIGAGMSSGIWNTMLSMDIVLRRARLSHPHLPGMLFAGPAVNAPNGCPQNVSSAIGRSSAGCSGCGRC